MENRLKKGQSVLGDLSVRLLSYAQMKGKTMARIGDFTRILGISKNQERNLLSRLAQSGFIIRLRRGVYLLPEKIPSGGSYNPGTAYILEKLFEDLEGKYQLCGPACFNFYGFHEQIPNMWHVYNNKISGTRSITERSFMFIKVGEGRLGSVEQVHTDSGSALVYSSKLRTLVDAVYDWWRFQSLPRAYRWIQETCTDKNTAAELIDLTLRYGNQSTIRRIGFILDRRTGIETNLDKLTRALMSERSLIPLVPGGDARGKTDTKWGIIQNE
jgi:predicted transcriptional regulator of viral defense system